MSEDLLQVAPAGALVGELSVPGDKSISHRAVMVGALSDDRVTVTGFGVSADTLATVDAFRAMGVPIERVGDDGLVIDGVGMRGLRPPDGVIDVRNAGTLMRILPGILAGQSGNLHAGRRREHPPPADAPDRRPAGADGRVRSRPARGCRR